MWKILYIFNNSKKKQIIRKSGQKTMHLLQKFGFIANRSSQS